MFCGSTSKRVRPLQDPMTLLVKTSPEVKYSTSFFTDSRGCDIHTRCWVPATTEVRAAIVIVHGMHGHTLSSFAAMDFGYEGSSIQAYVKAGCAVHALDHQAMGLSGGISKHRAHLLSLDDLSANVRQYAMAVKAEHNGLPLFIHGVCFGGLVTLRACLLWPDEQLADGLILTSPLVAADEEAKKSNATAIKLLGLLKMICPTLGVADSGGGAHKFPEISERWARSELTYKGKIRVSLGAELLRVLPLLEAGLPNIKLPFIALHAREDVLADPRGTALLFESAATTAADKELVLVDDFYHDLLLEPGREQVFTKIVAWLDARLALKDGATAAPVATHSPKETKQLMAVFRKKAKEVVASRRTLAAWSDPTVPKRSGMFGKIGVAIG